MASEQSTVQALMQTVIMVVREADKAVTNAIPIHTAPRLSGLLLR